MRDLISKRTRTKFREVLVGWTLREISTEFENEDFKADLTFDPGVGGQRRQLVEQFYHNVRFDDPGHVRRLLRVYSEVIRRTRDTDNDLAGALNASIFDDGIEFDKQGRWIVPDRRMELSNVAAVAAELSAESLQALIGRITSSIDSDPALALGSSKEMIESVCKTILSERAPDVDSKLEFAPLVKATLKELRLLPDDISDKAKGGDAIKRLLSGMNGALGGLNELRNLYGTGHGKDGRAKGITPRHARLAAGLAATMAVFLFETHKVRGKETE